ncbi:carboxy terminal-processing peptidase [Ferruginibacter albus]|uniref:carboxy terminal-processing peptidase n=1 Tax=Ferruginibacter albus TaxID=2875540 RepID=UPI001CC6D491|nr:carboxy terminal-processing peptidase [Ferruginibacter albus]
MSKKFLPIMLALTVASFFVAFQTNGKQSGGGDNPKSKNEKILRNIGLLLEQGHYSPKTINDAFSKEVLNRFEKELDEDKTIFLQSDIDSFKVYETRIDDEIHGTASLESFYHIADAYTRRLNQASEFYTPLLAKPFDFSKDEKIQLDSDKMQYPATDADRKEAWRKRLKYLVLTRYADALDDREKNKGKKDFVFKADSTLERESRDQVRKQIGRFFTTLKTHNTSDELFSTFVNSITSEMDPHTDYFPPVDARSFNESISGSFFGIGAQLKEDDSKIKIASLVTGGPAWKGGELQVNDEILKIAEGKGEPVDVSGYAVSDAVKLIRGAQKGTEVRLTVRKVDGTIKVISLLRDQIKLDDTFAKSAIINGEHKVGYIYLPEFYVDFERPNGARCSQDVAKEIEKLKAENVEGIIMDLRGNGGGSLPEVVKMVGLFIPDGPVCQVKSRDEKPYPYKDLDKSVLYNGPLMVMVDENSASASEIFAAAIQDYKRGIIIGSSSTYGKGTVQRNIPLNPESEGGMFSSTEKEEDLGTVKLTLQKFYRISGGATQLKGVTPDIVIPDRFEYLKSREKDNPSALSWDGIEKADYTPWTSNYSYDAVVKAANGQISSSNSLNQFKQDIQWLNTENDKEYSLNLAQFKDETKKVKDVYKQLDSLSKPAKDLDVKNIVADTTNFSADKEKSEKNKQFLTRIKGDMYIDESVKVIDNMIAQSNLAATKVEQQ